MRLNKILILAITILTLTGCGKIDSSKYINYGIGEKTVTFSTLKKIAYQDEELVIPDLKKEFGWESAEYSIIEMEKGDLQTRGYNLIFEKKKNTLNSVWLTIYDKSQYANEFFESDVSYLIENYEEEIIDNIMFYTEEGISETNTYFKKYAFLKNDRVHYVQMFDEALIDNQTIIKIYNLF